MLYIPICTIERHYIFVYIHIHQHSEERAICSMISTHACISRPQKMQTGCQKHRLLLVGPIPRCSCA